MQNLVTRFIEDESGATAIEYGLIAALISIVIITAATSVGTSVSAKFDEVNTKISGASGVQGTGTP